MTLANRHGISATVIAYGATLQSVIVPDRVGVPADITLGHATLEEYLANTAYFGSSVGRVANRIAVFANGRITGTLRNEEASQEKIMQLAAHGEED